MPGFASADPHTLPTLSITRVNGGSRSNAIMSPVRNVEQVDLITSRIDQRRSAMFSKDMNTTVHMDDMAVEESLSHYCKPVELYNIIQRRALRNPIFLQRCLSYKMEVARRKRIKMTIRVPRILSGSGEIFWNTSRVKGNTSFLNSELQEQQFWSVFVMLTSPISNPGMGHTIYRLSQTRVLKVPLFNPTLCGITGQAGVAFLLPEVRKLLLTAKKDGDVILFITCANPTILCNGKGGQLNSLDSLRGPVLWGSLPVTICCHSWMNHLSNGASITGLNGDRVDGNFQIELHPSRLQHEDFADGPCIKFHAAANGPNRKSMLRLQLCISAEEVGRTLCRSGSLVTSGHASASSLFSQARRHRTGRVIYRYYYHFNQHSKTEVTEDYSCPFCLVACASFKGLSCHLNSTHDLFNFEFLATPDHQVVNVTCQNDILGPEGNVRDLDGLNDPRLKNFVYWSRSGRPRKFCDRTPVRTQPLDSEQQPPIPPETGNLGINLFRSQQPTSLVPSIISSLQQNIVCKNNLESRTLLDGSLNLENNHVQNTSERRNDQSAAASHSSLHNAAVATEPSNLQVKASSLQDHSNKHERQEVHESMFKALDEENPSSQLKKRQRSEIIDEQTKAQISDGLPSSSASGVCLATATTMSIDECAVPISVKDQGQPAALRVENRKISVERAGARNRALLQKRQFFHSHTSQPMALEHLFSDRDSEDEVDDEITDVEDRRMLDDFVDVTRDEKRLMHMWNSFVRKQRVIADGHCPWACEAFSKLHAAKFAENAALRRCLMLFLTKLWNHHLVDGSTINRCLSITDSYEESLKKDKTASF